MFSDNENLKNNIKPVNKNDSRVVYAPYVVVDGPTLVEDDKVTMNKCWIHPISCKYFTFQINL